MTTDKFRKMALEIPTAVERSHMNHPDFRIAGKIFASLGVPDENWAMVKLTRQQQRAFIEKAPQVPRMFILPPLCRACCALRSIWLQRMSVRA